MHLIIIHLQLNIEIIVKFNFLMKYQELMKIIKMKISRKKWAKAIEHSQGYLSL
jgi:hypothetical protein